LPWLLIGVTGSVLADAMMVADVGTADDGATDAAEDKRVTFIFSVKKLGNVYVSTSDGNT
jgi:hypothetical protein